MNKNTLICDMTEDCKFYTLRLRFENSDTEYTIAQIPRENMKLLKSQIAEILEKHDNTTFEYGDVIKSIRNDVDLNKSHSDTLKKP